MKTIITITPKQHALLAQIAKLADNTAELHVDRPAGVSGDVLAVLKREELANAHGKVLWITKKGLLTLETPPPAKVADTSKEDAKAAKEKEKTDKAAARAQSQLDAKKSKEDAKLTAKAAKAKPVMSDEQKSAKKIAIKELKALQVEATKAEALIADIRAKITASTLEELKEFRIASLARAEARAKGTATRLGYIVEDLEAQIAA